MHSDPLSSSLSCQSAANRSQAGRETRLPSLWTGALGASSQHLSTKEHVTCTWGKPSPWDTPLMEGKEHHQRQSEGGGKLPPGT